MNLRVRYPDGQSVLKDVNPTDTIQTLIKNSFTSLGLDVEVYKCLKIMSGFPPQPLNIIDQSLPIDSLGLKSGDTLIYQVVKMAEGEALSKHGITAKAAASSSTGDTGSLINTSKTSPQMVFGSKQEERNLDESSKHSANSSNKSVSNGTESSKPTAEERSKPTAEERSKPTAEESSKPTAEERSKRLKTESKIRLKRQVVPADNSCLFTAINFCMGGKVVGSEFTMYMREIISDKISSSPELYTEAFLGNTNTQYCRDIESKDTWGGAIDLQILADSFQIVIAVVDTQSGFVTKFGESGNYSEMMLLIYDGIHYDPLFQEFPTKKLMFFASDSSVLETAKQLAEQERLAHNYTDTAGFTLKCLVCGHRMKGEREAQAHAQTSKHINFSEV